MYATNYFERGILSTMKGITLTAPSKIYIGLFLSNPGETGSAGSEVDYSGYSRQEVIFTEPAKMLNGIGIKNIEDIQFATSSKEVGTATFIGLSDSKIGGNMLAYGKVTEDLPISAGEAPMLLSGEITYYLTGDLSIDYKTKVLNVLRGKNIQGFTPCMSLFSGDPENGGAELTGENYERIELNFGVPKVTEAGQTEIKLAETARFPRPTTTWGNWAYTAIFDKFENGNPVWIQAKNPSKPIKKSYTPIINEGELIASIN